MRPSLTRLNRGSSIVSVSSPEFTVGQHSGCLRASSEPSASLAPLSSAYSLAVCSASRTCTLDCKPDGSACTESR